MFCVVDGTRDMCNWVASLSPFNITLPNSSTGGTTDIVDASLASFVGLFAAVELVGHMVVRQAAVVSQLVGALSPVNHKRLHQG